MISRRKKIVFAAVVLGLVLVIATFTFRISVTLNLDWSVSEGDSFTYQITSFDRYANFNDTSIIATITELPFLFPIVTAYSFAKFVIEVTKINCTFQNGSSLQEWTSYFETKISNCILPTGDWSLIEWLYPDPGPKYYARGGVPSTYISERYDDYFALGYVRVGFDSTSGWYARISMDSGIPIYIEFWTWGVDHSANFTGWPYPEYRVKMKLNLTV